MKALVLAGGRGSRLGEGSNEKNKCMLQINGKPLIEHNLDCLEFTGISQVVIVVGYRAEEIINTYGIRHKNKSIEYVIQNGQRGLVHAIECAEDALDKEDFMLMLGDEFMLSPRHEQMIEEYKKEDLFGVCGVLTVDDINLIRKTYSIIESEDNRIYRLIEKPSRPMNNIMGTGNCIFKNEIFAYIEQTPINQKRGEKELPDLIQCAIDDGNIVKSFKICDRYVNVNSKKEFQNLRSYFAHL